jgi:myo-inositol-1(or 4)-monophosphatase
MVVRRNRGSVRQTDRCELEELRELAVRLARKATRLHQARADNVNVIATKSTPTDFVSEVDRDAERLLVEVLHRERPNDAVLAEEMTISSGSSGVRWVIDPLDGTVNYLHGYPAYGASVAVEVNDHIVAGAVTDSVAGSVYSAAKGCGATRDEQPLLLGEAPPLSSAVVATGFSYEAQQRKLQGEVLARIVNRLGDVRRSGAAAFDLCQLAAGHVDAYFELDLAVWDFAAGGLIAEEAGARVVKLPAAHGQGPAIVAAHPALIAPLVDLLREAGALRPTPSRSTRPHGSCTTEAQ